MTRWWKPAGTGRFQYKRWCVQKAWESNLWDVYFDNELKAEGFGSAVEAMEEAEKLGA